MAALRTSIWIPEHPQRVADRHPGSSCEDPGSVCDSRLAADRPRKGRREPVGLAQFLSAVLPHALGATGTSGAKLQTASASMPFFSMI